MISRESIATLNPDLTPQIMAEVDEVVRTNKDKPGSLIPVLEECQRIVGYLPPELLEYIGEGLDVPGSDVYGVVTFYSFFSMIPKGRHAIKVCMGTACYVRGVAEVLNRLQSEYKLQVGGTTDDRRFSLEAVRCLGACGLAPVLVVDKDTHGGVSPESVMEILERYE